jgi:xanthosine utilization system XapX-like protein
MRTGQSTAMKYVGVILFGLGLGIFFAFLTAIIFVAESSPFTIAGLIVGLVLIGLGIYTTILEYKSLKNNSSRQTAQRAPANLKQKQMNLNSFS